MSINDPRLSTTEGVALVAAIKSFLADFPAADPGVWLSALSTFQIVSVCVHSMGSVDDRSRLGEAWIAVVAWTEEHEHGKTARWQLDQFMGAWDD